jgi:glycosyltransferase involved in cell wall biosynthesis
MIPRVSVIIPTYNRSEKVQKSVESALAQSFTDFEVIVVDDGSTDDTEQALNRVFGDHIRYYFQANQGASVARNRGIKEAKGEWVAFLDSDDLWEREKLECQLAALDRFGTKCNACYTDVRFYNHSETRTMFQLAESSYSHQDAMGINSEALRLLVKPGGAGMVVCLSSLLVRKAAIETSGNFNSRLLYSQDSEFMFRLALKTGFCYVNRPLVLFDRSPVEVRHTGVSSAWNRLDFFLQDSQLRLEELLNLTQKQPLAIRNLVRRQLSAVHSGWVDCYLEAGQYEKARQAAFKALRLNLTLSMAAKWSLAWISPRLALQVVRHRESKRASAFTV